MHVFNNNDLSEKKLSDLLKNSFEEIIENEENAFSEQFFFKVHRVLFDYTTLSQRNDFSIHYENFQKITDCIFIAKTYFDESVEEESINKIMTTLVILDYFSQDYNLLNVERISSSFKEKIFNLFDSLKIEIGIPEDAPYDERKMIEVFTDAKSNNDYNKVISVMDNLKYHSRVFDPLERITKVMIDFFQFIDFSHLKNSIVKIKNFEKVEIVLSCLNIIDYYQNFIESGNDYLIIRSTKYFFDELEQQYSKNNKITEIPDYTRFIDFLFSNEKLNFTTYVKNLRLQYLQSYNYLFGWNLAKNKTLLQDYMNHISYRIAEATAFSLGFINHFEATSSSLLTIAEIEKSFFKNEIKSFTNLNYFTGFLNLFIFYYSKKYPNRDVYLRELNNSSNTICSIQNSWDFSNLQHNWIKLFYLSFANICNNYSFTDDELKENIPVLYDNRNTLKEDKDCIELMKMILRNSKQYCKIKLWDGIGERTIEINKNNNIN